MHLLMITFQLNGISEADYLARNKEDATLLARFPGLYSKVQLADAAANTYGGMYLWKDERAMEAFAHSDIVKAIAARPYLTNFSIKDYDIEEERSHVTWSIVTWHALA